MTYFKPIDAICHRCRNDKRRRIYRVRYNLGRSRNRVSLLCEHSKPHYTPKGVNNPHVADLLVEVKKHPTFPVPCAYCGRVIHAQGWDRPAADDSPTFDLVDRFFPQRHPLPRNFVCSKACFQALLAEQARRRRAARPDTRCRNCGTVFTARRGAKYCSTRCRVAAHRARMAPKSG